MAQKAKYSSNSTRHDLCTLHSRKKAGDYARTVADASDDLDAPPVAPSEQRTSRRLQSRNVLSAPPSGGRATEGLARLGSRAALSFAFAFLRRAWRSGEDGDLCTDLLEESLDALLMLPEASMFHAESLSPVWTEVVERTTRFLRAVVTGDRHGCQMALAGFLDFMCLALRASGLWLRYAMLQNLIPSFPWIAPGSRSGGAIQGKEGIKFCSVA